MATAQINPVLRYTRQLAAHQLATALPDAQLLERYTHQRDEQAFAALVRRHAALVLGACRRVLHDGHAADDAFQATFVVLARKAGSLRRPAVLGPWLYSVATRTALKIRGQEQRRRTVERLAAVSTATDPPDSLVWRDLRGVLDEAIASLAERYRVPFVLHHLEGVTVAEVARQLGCPQGTVAARLVRAKEQLRRRLAHKGLVASLGGLLAMVSNNAVSAGVSAPLLVSTVRMATVALGQEMVREAGPVTVATLVQGGIQAMLATKVKVVAAVLLSVGTVGGVGLFGQLSEQAATGVQASAPQRSERKPSAPDAKPKKACAEIQNDDDHGIPILPPLLPGGTMLDNPPSTAAILRALPAKARSIPNVYEESRDNFDVVVERLVDRLDAPRFFPLVGPARLRHLHYKCTVSFTETIQANYPFPFQCQRRRSEIIYWDRDQLYLVTPPPNPKVGADFTTIVNVTGAASGVATLKEKPTGQEEKNIKLQQAEKDFQLAEFYQRTGHFDSARFYYDLVCRRYPETTFAKNATARLGEMRAIAVVNGRTILREEVYDAAILSISDNYDLNPLERAYRLSALWKSTLDRLVEREVVLQHALASLLNRNPKIVEKLQATATREFDRQWVELTKKNTGLKKDEELKAMLRAQGTSLEAVSRQWQRDFMLREYRRSLRTTTLEEAADRDWRRLVTELKRAAVIEYPEGQ